MCLIDLLIYLHQRVGGLSLEKGAGGAQLLGRVTAPRRIRKKQHTLSRETAIQQVGIGNAFRFLRRGLPIWKFGVGGNVSPPALGSGHVQQAEGKSGRKTEPCPFTFLLWNSFKKGAGVLFISLGYCSLGAWSESAIAAVGRWVLQRVPTLYTSVSPTIGLEKAPARVPGPTRNAELDRSSAPVPAGLRGGGGPAPLPALGDALQTHRHQWGISSSQSHTMKPLLNIYRTCTGHCSRNCQGVRD